MNQLLVILLVILFLLFFTNYSINTSYEFFGEYQVSKIGTISDMFPRKSKGIKTKLPVERDKIEDVQNIDPDVVRYLYD